MDELIAKNPRLLKEYREKVAKKRYLKRKGKKKKIRGRISVLFIDKCTRNNTITLH
ncbi:hypothetical protein [Acinetobacter towneri]|uniref:hypothetical protein n=1 Tax=Acinetobacter towneri TaxID=202956 RepID=UPI00209B253E|nr:hypothetical protein [Acinetobacter towneri]MCO8055538.1 hypothetical protein [Acinetobacter towneri]